MKIRKQDENGDYVFGTAADFHQDVPAAVAQAALTRLLLFAGEWFVDVADGMPWRTDVLGKYTKEAYDTVMKQRVLGTPGARAVLDYVSNFDGNTRRLTFSFTLDTIYGQAPAQGTI